MKQSKVSDVRPEHGVALVGYRGTGKSTVGRLLAARLRRPFVDADEALETRLGRSIRTIFAEDGEPVFRDEEEATLRLLADRPGIVLATGGGVVLRASNRALLRRIGPVVWLTADTTTLESRLGRDARNVRPALTQAGALGEIASVLEQRLPLYREVADLIVDTSSRAPRDVVEDIARAIESRELAHLEARS